MKVNSNNINIPGTDDKLKFSNNKAVITCFNYPKGKNMIISSI